MKKVSLLIPVYNEEKSLPLLYDALVAFFDTPGADGKPISGKYDFEVLMVNDGSSDASLSVLELLHIRDSRFHYLSLSRNFGKETALLAGLDFVSSDCAVILDADLQHPLEVIPEMIAKWEEGYEDVYGSRTTRGKEPWLRKKLSLMYYKLLQKSTRIEILPNVGDFRLLDRRCVDTLCCLRESQRYMKGLYCWMGFKKTEVKYEQKESVRQASSFSYHSLLNLAIEGITTYTTAPLRISSIMGFIVSFLSILYMIFICIKTIFFGEAIQGFPTLMCAILLIGGVQLIAIGIIGEYMGRIFNETKNRPVYIPDIYDGEKISIKASVKGLSDKKC